MSKPVGVTISAVLVVLGSFLWMILGLLALVGAVTQGAESPLSPWVRYGSASSLMILSAWGLLTGVGLFMWKHWARISILVFAGLVIYGFVTWVLLNTFYWLIQGNSMLGGQEGVVFIVFLLPGGDFRLVAGAVHQRFGEVSFFATCQDFPKTGEHHGDINFIDDGERDRGTVCALYANGVSGIFFHRMACCCRRFGDWGVRRIRRIRTFPSGRVGPQINLPLLRLYSPQPVFVYL